MNGRWVYQERGGGPFGPVTHIFSRGAKIAYQYWLRKVEFVEIQSPWGGECRVRNPWGEGQVTLYRNGQKAETLSGSLWPLGTQTGETMVVVRPDTTPEQFKQTVPAPGSR